MTISVASLALDIQMRYGVRVTCMSFGYARVVCAQQTVQVSYSCVSL